MKKKMIHVCFLFLAVIICSNCGNNSTIRDDSKNRNTAKVSVEMQVEMQFREHPASFDQIKTDGMLAERMSLNLDKLINLRHIHTRYTGWGADQIGRWIGTTILEASLLDSKPSMEIIGEKVNELISEQGQDGFYYGDELRSQPDRYRQCWFGQGRGIWNMLEYYNITGDKKTLESLVRAAEHIVDKRSEWKISKPLSGGIESAVGPMARLGVLTGNQDFIEWSKDIADNIQHEVAPPSSVPTAHVESTNLFTHEMKPLFHHTHSYLSTTHGVVDLAVITGERKYFDQAKKVFDDSYSSVWGNGIFPESYGDLYERIDETCSTVDWIYLALKLFSITGEVIYLDAAELSAINGLLFEQNDLGGFDTYRSLNRHSWGDSTNWGGEQTDCCSMSGGWGLAQVALYTITSNDMGISINLPFDVGVDFPFGNGTINAVQKTITGKYKLTQDIRVNNTSGEKSNVRIRIPYWSESSKIYVNDKLVKHTVNEGFVDISCAGNSTLHIVCVHPMTFKEIPARRNILSRDTPVVAGDAREVGVQYGPYVLMYYRELFPFSEKDIRIDICQDKNRQPIVAQSIPSDWHSKGAVPLLIEASVNSKGKVYLTPCANSTMMKFINPDPYVMRFSKIDFVKENKISDWLLIPPPTIKTSHPLFRDSTLVTLESIFEQARIYYTLDGSEPSGNSIKYSVPFYLKNSAFIKARSIGADGSESNASIAFIRNRQEPIRPVGISSLQKGLRYSYYDEEIRYKYLPDFTKLSPSKTGMVPSINIDGIKNKEDNFAIRFTGYIDIPGDGKYSFYTVSDDGSKLLINDFPIVDNDGTHGMIEASGDVLLQKGKYKIEVQYFESLLEQGLQVSYEGPGISKTEIPASVLYSKNK